MKSKSGFKGSEFVRWFRPLIDCLHELGAARPQEAADWIAEKENVPLEVREAVYGSGLSKLPHQIRFARQYLVWEGLIDDSTKGIWSLTPIGAKTHLTDDQARAICAKWNKIHSANRPKQEVETEGLAADISKKKHPVPVDNETVEEAGLLKVLRSLSATGFEHICRHLLLAYGFQNVTVTKRSGDDGIDGYGTLQLNPLVSSVVVFQCKRFKGSVGREAVALLRSDAHQRADKAILVTTGTFTRPAKDEAIRVIPHVELIDGEQLVGMFEKKQIGLRPRIVYDIDHAFFAPFYFSPPK